MNITIFTDGSSRGNPGPGGWGSLIINGSSVVELGGGGKDTTNNRMELTAVIEGLRKIQNSRFKIQEEAQVQIYTDSSYLINGITKWIKGWKRNGWKRIDWKTKVEHELLNKDLWIDLDEALNKVGTEDVSWKYVGGHVGIAGNERCDEIATGFADGTKVKLYKGSLSNYSNPKILDISHDQEKVKSKKSNSSKHKTKAYSYVSSVSGEIKIHKTWAECEKRVKGSNGAKYKKSLDALDEAEIIEKWRSDLHFTHHL